LNQFSNAQQVSAQISDSERLLFDTEWSGSIESQIERYKATFLQEMAPEFVPKSIGEVIQTNLIGRMMQANAALFRASQYAGHPLVDAPTSWQYLLWKYQYDGRRHTELKSEITDVLISKAISIEGSSEIGLITGVPQEALIDLRQAGAMAELRSLIRSGMKQVDEASDATVAEVSEAVIQNLSTAFENHKKELAEFSSKKRLLGFDIGKWITLGGLSIGAAATGNTSIAVLSALAGMVGTPSPKELSDRWKEIQATKQHIARSPSGILFRHIDAKHLPPTSG
jgi:hypothetical protein